VSRVERFYDSGVYEHWPDEDQVRSSVFLRSRLNKSLDLIAKQRPSRVLDVGCGNGVFSQRIQKATGAVVSGIDISLKSAEQAQARGVDARQCDVDEDGICYDAETFDLVFCGEVIEHIFDPDRLLEEIWRVLIPGGHLVISTPNLAAWYNRVLLFLGIQPIFTDTSTRKTLGRYVPLLGQGSRPVGHLRVYTLAGLKDVLREYGFTILRVQAVPFLPYPILRELDRLIGLIPSLGSDLLVLARKGQ
jgi:methionine biosynthesis protein MetW